VYALEDGSGEDDDGDGDDEGKAEDDGKCDAAADAADAAADCDEELLFFSETMSRSFEARSDLFPLQ
jgi:hypothetical protein